MEGMKISPMISIIMPVYNAEQYVEDTVKSVLKQTFGDFELIMVDDGSRDSSGDICDRLALQDSRVVAIHQQNGGISAARNTGLDVAKGTYITFCDNDDYVSPDWLYMMYRNIEDRDLVISGFSFCTRKEYRSTGFCGNEANDVLVDIIDVQAMKEKFPLVDATNNGSVWRQLFKSSIIKENKLRFEKIKYEDLLFSYQYILHINSLRQISHQGYCHIINPESTGASHKYIAELDWIEKMESLHEQINQRFDIHNIEYQNQLNVRFAIHASSFLLKGYYPECRVSKKERLNRWKEMRKDSWFKSIDIQSVKIKKVKLVMLVTKYKLYGLLDSFFLLIAQKY